MAAFVQEPQAVHAQARYGRGRRGLPVGVLGGVGVVDPADQVVQLALAGGAVWSLVAG